MLPRCLLPLAAGLALAAGPAAALAATSRAPLAYVAEATGTVEVLRAGLGRRERVSPGAPLARGDRLTVGPRAAATLLFRDGSLLELPEHSAFRLGGRSPRPARPADPALAAAFRSLAEGVVGGSRERGLVALAPPRGGTLRELILSPRHTAVLEPRPTFRWRRVEGASGYDLVVSSAGVERWRRTVSDTALGYPADAPALPAGEHAWELSVLGSGGRALGREAAVFRVESEEAAQEIRSELARIDSSGGAGARARAFLAGAYLAGRGHWAEAAARLRGLCAAAPGDPGAHEALGRVYLAMGLDEAAAVELQRALEAARAP